MKKIKDKAFLERQRLRKFKREQKKKSLAKFIRTLGGRAQWNFYKFMQLVRAEQREQVKKEATKVGETI